MKREKVLRKKVAKYFRARYEEVKVIPEVGLFNHKCFLNAVQYAKDSGCHVYECVVIENNWPSLHYIVKDETENTFHEVALGYKAELSEYYILRKIAEKDWNHIESIFESSLNSWTLQFTTWYDRKIRGIERIL